MLLLYYSFIQQALVKPHFAFDGILMTIDHHRTIVKHMGFCWCSVKQNTTVLLYLCLQIHDIESQKLKEKGKAHKTFGFLCHVSE